MYIYIYICICTYIGDIDAFTKNLFFGISRRSSQEVRRIPCCNTARLSSVYVIYLKKEKKK